MFLVPFCHSFSRQFFFFHFMIILFFLNHEIELKLTHPSVHEKYDKTVFKKIKK